MTDEGYEGIRHVGDGEKATYVMVPRKLMITIATVFACLLALNVATLQWANYIDQRSNKRWCNIVKIFNETYQNEPPPTVIGQILQVEFLKLGRDFKCK